MLGRFKDDSLLHFQDEEKSPQRGSGLLSSTESVRWVERNSLS